MHVQSPGPDDYENRSCDEMIVAAIVILRGPIAIGNPIINLTLLLGLILLSSTSSPSSSSSSSSSLLSQHLYHHDQSPMIPVGRQYCRNSGSSTTTTSPSTTTMNNNALDNHHLQSSLSQLQLTSQRTYLSKTIRKNSARPDRMRLRCSWCSCRGHKLRRGAPALGP